MNTELFEERNAIIKSVSITNDDHGMLTVWLHLDYGGSGQGFGGYALYLPEGSRHHNVKGTAGHFIWRCMEIAGVTEWSGMVGKTIRVRASHTKIEEIGHIVNHDWFNPRKDFENIEF